jgi:hypothetical protein
VIIDHVPSGTTLPLVIADFQDAGICTSQNGLAAIGTAVFVGDVLAESCA